MKNCAHGLLCFFILAYSLAGAQTRQETDSLNTLVERLLSEPQRALPLAQQALRVAKQLNYEEGVAKSHQNLGLIFLEWNQPGKAIEFLTKSLKYYSSKKDKRRVADLQNQLARVNISIGEFEKAEEFLNKSLSYNLLSKNKHGLASNYNNLATIYKYNYELDTAIALSRKSLELYKALNDSAAMFNVLVNLGGIYGESAELGQEALYYQEALYLSEKSPGIVRNKSSLLYNYAISLLSLRQPDEAVKRLSEAVNDAEKNTDYESMAQSYEMLYSIFKNVYRDPQRALENLELAKAFRDSSATKEGLKKILQIQMQTEFEEKQRADSLAQAQVIERNKIQFEERNKRSQIIAGSMAVFLLLLGVVAFILFRQNKQKEKANKIISDQNKEIEEKSKEILDSIQYAKKIQDAVLPAEDQIQELFPDTFVYYRPKDIVGGDFYFATRSRKEEGARFIVVADCTGHGVPGGFMSMLGTSFLQEIIEEDGETNPGFILNRLRHKVIMALKQSENLMQNKDGMDITLVKVNSTTATISWSLANHSTYFLCRQPFEAAEGMPWCALVEERNGLYLYKMKGQKQPIGYFPDMSTFETRTIPVSIVRSVFMFSDGVTDQFGGPKVKKFKHSSVEQWIWDTILLTKTGQKNELDRRMLEWQGTQEQLDDICLVSVSFLNQPEKDEIAAHSIAATEQISGSDVIQ